MTPYVDIFSPLRSKEFFVVTVGRTRAKGMVVDMPDTDEYLFTCETLFEFGPCPFGHLPCTSTRAHHTNVITL